MGFQCFVFDFSGKASDNWTEKEKQTEALE